MHPHFYDILTHYSPPPGATIVAVARCGNEVEGVWGVVGRGRLGRGLAVALQSDSIVRVCACAHPPHPRVKNFYY